MTLVTEGLIQLAFGLCSFDLSQFFLNVILASSVAKFPTGEKNFEFCCHCWGMQLSQLERYLNQCEVCVHLWYRIDNAVSIFPGHPSFESVIK